MKARLLGIAIATLGACGGGGSKPADPDSNTGPDSPPDSGNQTGVPRVETVPCKFNVSASLGLTEGTHYKCGDLIAYENRAMPTRTIRMHYIQFENAASTSPNATIYLDGGPGGSGEGIVSYINVLGSSFLQNLHVDGDFLVIGQRGTALSQPFLDCVSSDCSEFASQADLTAYNTAYNADDVNDLRASLGYDKLNVYGISYGSRLGLEVLRRHGPHVRAALIEGLVPSQITWPAAIPASFYSALVGLDAACTGACETAYGNNLVAKFQTGVDALNANPAPVNTSQGSFDLDGYTYAQLLFRFFYSKSTYPYLPLMISDLAVRRTDRIADFLGGFGGGGGSGISAGLYYGVVCGELFNPPDQTAFETANQNVPQFFKDLYGGSWSSMLSQCEQYPKGTLQATLKQPVTSGVRTFVSSGALDPITPPSFGDVAMQGLSNAFHVVHANSGHGATLQTPCGRNNLAAFFTNPTATQDTSCAATITTAWVMPSAFNAEPIPFAKIRAELDLVPIPPLRMPK
jgi:pimeloyl-ACP methyl ester carboxylesterase